METIPERGSSRLREAWKNRTLTEESVESIAVALEQSQATIDKVSFTGGDAPTSMTLALSYEGDDVPICGNDLLFWQKWHHRFGNGTWVPPKVIINGIINPDVLKMVLTFGEAPAASPSANEGPVVDVGALPQVGGLVAGLGG